MIEEIRRVSGWSSASVEANEDEENVHISCKQDGIYEITFSTEPLNLHLGSDYSGVYVVIQSITEDKSYDSIRSVATVGDVLISVNGHIVFNDDFSDVIEFLDMLHMGGLPRRLRFLNTKVQSVAVFRESLALQVKGEKDMFGFNRSLEYLLAEKLYNISQADCLIQRDLQWVEYLKQIGGADNLKPAGAFKPSWDLKAIVRQGIPAAFRPLLWQKISLSSIHRLKYPKDYYESLLARIDDLCVKVRDDIEKDVDRTFPEHDYFERGVGGEGLRRVLRAYALHNPSVGYCQSLNFVVGMMLLFLHEEDAFWLLMTVIETLLPPDYYTKSMVGAYTDQLVLTRIVEKTMPKVYSVLEEAQLQLHLITLPWFMCLFINTLRPEIALRVWDMFLCEGSKVLFRVSVALLKLHESKILAAHDPGDLFTLMKDLGKDVVDPDTLIALAYKSFNPVSSRPQKKSGNPRLGRVGRNSAKNRVPADLTGIGLAHCGPERSFTPTSNDSRSQSPVADFLPVLEGGGGELSLSSPQISIDTPRPDVLPVPAHLRPSSPLTFWASYLPTSLSLSAIVRGALSSSPYTTESSVTPPPATADATATATVATSDEGIHSSTGGSAAAVSVLSTGTGINSYPSSSSSSSAAGASTGTITAAAALDARHGVDGKVADDDNEFELEDTKSAADVEHVFTEAHADNNDTDEIIVAEAKILNCGDGDTSTTPRLISPSESALEDVTTPMSGQSSPFFRPFLFDRKPAAAQSHIQGHSYSNNNEDNTSHRPPQHPHCPSSAATAAITTTPTSTTTPTPANSTIPNGSSSSRQLLQQQEGAGRKIIRNIMETGSRRRTNKHCDFKRADIDAWRAELRKDMEERYDEMERARAESRSHSNSIAGSGSASAPSGSNSCSSSSDNIVSLAGAGGSSSSSTKNGTGKEQELREPPAIILAADADADDAAAATAVTTVVDDDNDNTVAMYSEPAGGDILLPVPATAVSLLYGDDDQK